VSRPDKKEQLKSRCSRFLCHHPPRTPRDIFASLAEATPADVIADRYGAGELIAGFEREVASLLGKEAAAFMPSGTMAQQIALRLWSDRRASKSVAFHPTSHLERHELRGHEHLHGLHSVIVGAPTDLLTLADLKKVPERLGAVLVELPQRSIGGQLPSWDELCAIAVWAAEKGIPLHMDGARLWEAGPFYARPYASIAGLFGSVYVSFYKGLGAIAGAVLAGPADFVAEARVWQRRHGGDLVHLFPYVCSARAAMAERLPKMPAYHAKAIEVARALGDVDGASILPDPPQASMMHVVLRGDRARIERAALEIAAETRTWLFPSLTPTGVPGHSLFELAVGDATLAIPTPEIAALLRTVLERAR
jgi:threonine aldolase